MATAKSKETKSKDTTITFDPKALGIDITDTVVYGVQVKPEAGKLVGTVSDEIAKAFIDAGKAK